MDWIEITIKTTTAGSDIMAQVLYEIGIKGVVIEDPADIALFKADVGDWDYIDESILQNVEDEVVVKGYLADDASSYDNIQYIRERIQGLLAQELGVDIGSGTMEISNVKEEDWANNWKKYFEPKKISDRIIIKPSWKDYEEQEGEVVLEMDPGMVFGTGTHETTILCMRALERWITPESKHLDIGCGTGILAIGAVLLGAPSAVAVDIDRNAVRVARENTRLNAVQDRVNVIEGNLLDKVDGIFDIITANIIADVIISMSADVKNYLKKKGIFIASGIILDRLQDVIDSLHKEGFKVLEKETMGEWAVLVAEHE